MSKAMGKVRWGVVGAGGIANRRTLPVIGDAGNCSLSVVMDVHAPEVLGEKFGVDATDSLQSVLAREDVDAVYVASPVHVHAEQVIAAARAGKHVLCEKPLALSLAEARTMVAACIEGGVLLREAYMLRHHGAHRAMEQLIRQNAIGKIVFASVHWAFLYPKTEGAWRQIPELGGGGSLADVGCHAFDLLHMLVGRISRVAAVAGTLVQDYQVDDLATVVLEFEGGAQGTVTTSFCLSPDTMPTSLSIFGAGGSIAADNTLTQETGGVVSIFTEADGQRREVEYEQVNTYVRQLEAFAESVLGGEIATVALEPDLLRSMAVLDAAYRSTRSGKFINV